MPIVTVIALVQGIITLIPSATNAIAAAYQAIDRLFEQKQITIEQQKELRDGVDKIAAQVKSGVVPDAFKVEPDPQ